MLFHSLRLLRKIALCPRPLENLRGGELPSLHLQIPQHYRCTFKCDQACTAEPEALCRARDDNDFSLKSFAQLSPPIEGIFPVT